MVSAARSAGRVLDVAFNHRRRGDVQRLRAGDRRRPPRPHVLRQGVVAAPHRHPDAGSWFTRVRAGGRRAAGRHRRARARLRALPARQPGRAHRQRLDLRPARHATASGRRRPRTSRAPATAWSASTSRTWPRSSCASTTAARCCWRPAGPPTGPTATSSARPSTAPRAGPSGIVDDYVEVGSLKLFGDDEGTATAESIEAEPGGKHLAVVQEFVDTVRSGDWQGHDGAGAAQLARIVDACYESAREQREVTLDAASILNAS